jgi:LPXTG-site transpeptidase (sortase) family protein
MIRLPHRSVCFGFRGFASRPRCSRAPTTRHWNAAWASSKTRPGTEGNVGIAGHRDGFFRALKDIAEGDAIELQTLGGRETYRVERTWIVEPEDVSVLDPTPSRSLTLVTCYPFYFVGSAPQRFIVRAVSVGNTQQ